MKGMPQIIEAFTVFSSSWRRSNDGINSKARNADILEGPDNNRKLPPTLEVTEYSSSIELRSITTCD